MSPPSAAGSGETGARHEGAEARTGVRERDDVSGHRQERVSPGDARIAERHLGQRIAPEGGRRGGEAHRPPVDHVQGDPARAHHASAHLERDLSQHARFGPPSGTCCRMRNAATRSPDASRSSTSRRAGAPARAARRRSLVPRQARPPSPRAPQASPQIGRRGRVVGRLEGPGGAVEIPGIRQHGRRCRQDRAIRLGQRGLRRTRQKSLAREKAHRAPVIAVGVRVGAAARASRTRTSQRSGSAGPSRSTTPAGIASSAACS